MLKRSHPPNHSEGTFFQRENHKRLNEVGVRERERRGEREGLLAGRDKTRDIFPVGLQLCCWKFKVVHININRVFSLTLCVSAAPGSQTQRVRSFVRLFVRLFVRGTYAQSFHSV